MSDEELITSVIGTICNYAVENGLEPNDTLKTMAENILALLEICNFNQWGRRNDH